LIPNAVLDELKVGEERLHQAILSMLETVITLLAKWAELIGKI
jgi:hypothetical protein